MVIFQFIRRPGKLSHLHSKAITLYVPQILGLAEVLQGLLWLAQFELSDLHNNRKYLFKTKYLPKLGYKSDLCLLDNKENTNPSSSDQLYACIPSRHESTNQRWSCKTCYTKIHEHNWITCTIPPPHSSSFCNWFSIFPHRLLSLFLRIMATHHQLLVHIKHGLLLFKTKRKLCQDRLAIQEEEISLRDKDL